MKKILIVIFFLLIFVSCEDQPWPPIGNRICEVCHGEKGVRCSRCMGRGRETCSQCHGWGIIKVYDKSTMTYVEERCPTCHGMGAFNCRGCNGRGYLIMCPKCNGLGYVPIYPTTEDMN